MPVIEYESGAAFPGVIGRTADASSPAWPAPVRSREGAPGRLQLCVDGTLAGNAEVPVTAPFVLIPCALTRGANPGSAITGNYPSPFKFTGTIESVTVDVSGELIYDPEAELRMHMARQ